MHRNIIYLIILCTASLNATGKSENAALTEELAPCRQNLIAQRSDFLTDSADQSHDIIEEDHQGTSIPESPLDTDSAASHLLAADEEEVLLEGYCLRIAKAIVRIFERPVLYFLTNYTSYSVLDYRNWIASPEECPCCCEIKKPFNFINGYGTIQKGFCASCSKRVIEASLFQTPKTFGVTEDGVYAVSGNDLRALGFPEHQVRYWEVMTSGGRKCCYAQCPGWGAFHTDRNGARCVSCQTQNCLTCEACHEAMTCDEYQLITDPTKNVWMAWLFPPKPYYGFKKYGGTVTETWEDYHERFYRPCPGCRERIQHESQCLHMTCRKCGYDFEYLRGIYDGSYRFPQSVWDATKFKDIKKTGKDLRNRKKTHVMQNTRGSGDSTKFNQWRTRALDYLKDHPDIERQWEEKQYEGVDEWRAERGLTGGNMLQRGMRQLGKAFW